jgi:hypothetical protein
MRFLVLTFILLASMSAHAELYVQRKSSSPDGSVIFAINYPPTERHPDTFSQLHLPMVEGCFLHPKTKERIGHFFYLEGTDAEVDHPGTHSFDGHNVFDYVWSADSTHVAITKNMRHFGIIYSFRRRDLAFQRLQMPELVTPLQERLAGVIQQSHHTSIKANGWQRRHRLVATISRDAQVTNTGNENKDWKEYSLQFTIAFDGDGKPTISATKSHVEN